MKSSQTDTVDQLIEWGYYENGSTGHEAIVMRHPVAGHVKIYSSPRDPDMSYRKVLHKAQRQLAAIGVIVTPPWKPMKPKDERKEAMMPRGQSAEQVAAKEQRLTRTIEYLTEHGPSPIQPLAAIAGVSEQSWFKQYGNRIPGLVRYREQRYQGGTLYGLPNQPQPAGTKIDTGPKQQPPTKPVGTGRCDQRGPTPYPCIRIPGHFGPHRDNHGHEWSDESSFTTKLFEQHVVDDGSKEPLEVEVPKPEITESDLVAQIERLQTGARERLVVIEEQQSQIFVTLDQLANERAFLEEFLGVNGTASGTASPAGSDDPTHRKRPYHRRSPRQEEMMALMSDGKHRDYHEVARELGITSGAASATLSLLFREEKLEMERGSYPRRYFVLEETV